MIKFWRGASTTRRPHTLLPVEIKQPSLAEGLCDHICCGAPVIVYNLGLVNPGGIMGIIRSLISVLQRWIARYMVALDYADVRSGADRYAK